MKSIMLPSVVLGCGVIVIAIFMVWYLSEKPVSESINNEADQVMCPMDAFECPDGTFVGRTGPDCTFVCPTDANTDESNTWVPVRDRDINNLIMVTAPQTGTVVTAPLIVTGEARGYWFFEGSFPITLVNWDGLIIAEGFATAEGEWMTEEFVPFSATLSFVNPYTMGSPSFMERGTLILQRDNPSGLPEHDAALEIPIRFAETN